MNLFLLVTNNVERKNANEFEQNFCFNLGLYGHSFEWKNYILYNCFSVYYFIPLGILETYWRTVLLMIKSVKYFEHLADI